MLISIVEGATKGDINRKRSKGDFKVTLNMYLITNPPNIKSIDIERRFSWRSGYD
jgi:hypothetical protein